MDMDDKKIFMRGEAFIKGIKLPFVLGGGGVLDLSKRQKTILKLIFTQF